jgi:hypothetical protein
VASATAGPGHLYWTNHKAPGRTAGTVVTKEVDFDKATG